MSSAQEPFTHQLTGLPGRREEADGVAEPERRRDCESQGSTRPVLNYPIPDPETTSVWHVADSETLTPYAAWQLSRWHFASWNANRRGRKT